MAAIGGGPTIYNGVGTTTTSFTDSRRTLHCSGHGPQIPERVCPGCYQNLKTAFRRLVEENERLSRENELLLKLEGRGE